MLVKYELKKLFLHPVIIAWLLLSLGGNFIFVIGSYNSSQSSTKIEGTNVYENLQGEAFAQRYIEKYGVVGKSAENIRKKYQKLQPVIEKKGKEKEAFSFYFGSQTPFMHANLFQTYFSILIIEMSLLALFIGLLSATFEVLQGTDHLIYTTRTGRGIIQSKYWSGLISTLVLGGIMLILSLVFYFLRNDFSMVWQAKVSSQFNSAVSEFGKLFMTWQSMTVKDYLLKSSVLSLGLSICFYLIGHLMALCYRKPYHVILSTVILLSGTFLVKYLFPIGSVLRGLFGLTPMWLWRTNGNWFTDGGADIIWSNYETKGLLSSLLLLCISQLIIKRQWLRKEWDSI